MAIHCDGDLTTSPDGTPVCSGVWMDEAASFNDLVLILQDAFSTPDASEVLVAFSAGMTIPLIAYLVARSFQSVIQFVK